jgi:peptidoglycan/xylan/chitin deacetylase (PgdA/CDA1 family)
VRHALALGLQPAFGGRRWSDEALVSTLKAQPDAVRRSFVSRLAGHLERRGLVPPSRVAGRDDLALWVSRGHAVGNHTWDHPCLDRCSPAAQREQLEKADDWLRLNLPRYEPVFAYPNGNWSGTTEAILGSLGYQAAFGFDHRLTRTQSPLRLSRLRVSADAPLPRFRSIVSGLHALPFALLGDRSSGADARDQVRVPS